jgi:hypothetical protein
VAASSCSHLGNAVLRPSHGVKLRGSAHCRLFPSHEMSEMKKKTTGTGAGPNSDLWVRPSLSLPASALQPWSRVL